ncbi:DUF4127 family protein [Phascolarctobacterium sp.]|uniref:DUF4127 family protein n=1 Tax=Phascolarctobacterium sp. TaxID=2049039 RepID=UPI00386EDF22
MNIYNLLKQTALCLASIFIMPNAYAKAPTIIYIPLDNRPVCAAYAEQTMTAAGCTIIQPPEKYISSVDRNGKPEELLDWLEHKAPKADAAVISTDSLLYGGLVASRTHHYTEAELSNRLQRLGELKKKLPINLFTFSTIMRTPRASKGRVEPPYYSKIGPDIFAYTQLMDKKDQRRLTSAEEIQLQMLTDRLPAADLQDWLERREKNFKVNTKLTRMALNGRFHYLAVGKDDNAPLSATHMEARHLSLDTFGTPAHTFQIIDGVDQLGLLLLVRAFNEITNNTAAIYTLYSPGPGAAVLPQYSDSRLQDSVPQQILAAGAVEAKTAAQADLILAINAPTDGVSKDSTADDNQYFASPANRSFTKTIKAQLDAGRDISLADISYSNGGDNGFMAFLAKEGILENLQAYNGWNTADNAIGYAIAQGIMAAYMDEDSRSKLLQQRLIDDWFYQSNIRSSISNEMVKHNREDLKYDLGRTAKDVTRYVNTEAKRLAKRYAVTKDCQFEIDLPWNRLFEIDVKIE